MAYYELDVQCERCGKKHIYVGDGRKGAVRAAKSHGWHFAVGTSYMPICPECQKPKADESVTTRDANPQAMS